MDWGIGADEASERRDLDRAVLLALILVSLLGTLNLIVAVHRRAMTRPMAASLPKSEPIVTPVEPRCARQRGRKNRR